jgi:hypothetical protein
MVAAVVLMRAVYEVGLESRLKPEASLQLGLNIAIVHAWT